MVSRMQDLIVGRSIVVLSISKATGQLVENWSTPWRISVELKRSLDTGSVGKCLSHWLSTLDYHVRAPFGKRFKRTHHWWSEIPWNSTFMFCGFHWSRSLVIKIFIHLGCYWCVHQVSFFSKNWFLCADVLFWQRVCVICFGHVLSKQNIMDSSS